MDHSHVALWLFMGPGLVIAAVNEVALEMIGGPSPVGMPVSEAYPEPEFAGIQAGLRETYRTHLQRRVAYVNGVVDIIPWVFLDGTVGVAAVLEPRTTQARVSHLEPLGQSAA